jgi:hypothetical protein
MIQRKGERRRKRLILAATMLVFCLTLYSCAYKCVTVPPPGGYPYGQPGEKK